MNECLFHVFELEIERALSTEPRAGVKGASIEVPLEDQLPVLVVFPERDCRCNGANSREDEQLPHADLDHDPNEDRRGEGEANE